MDTGEAWVNVGRKAKSLIRGCLVLDESQRLTAKQALLHPWFTNKHYAGDIEAAYQRAIQDWTPRERDANLVQFIDTTDAVPATARPEHVERLAEEVKSRHFQTTAPTAFTFFKTGAGVPQPKRARTPLPAISEEAEQDIIEVPASPRLPEHGCLFASPARVADTTHLPNEETQESLRRLPLEDFTLPCSQLTIIDPQLLASQQVGNDSVTQSQSTLDDSSPASLTPADDEVMHPRKKLCR